MIMHKFSTKIFFKLVILINGYEFVQPIIHSSTNNYYNNFAPESYTISSAATTTNNIINTEWLFRNNKSRVIDQQNPIRNYNMPKHDQLADYRLDGKFKTPLPKQLVKREHDWDRNHIYNMFDAQLQVGNVQDNSIMGSGDHLKKRHLPDYNEPSPTILEMPPNLHHHLPLIVYKTTTKTMSHATSNEPSPVTTETIKTLSSIKTFQEKHINFNNKLNYYDGNAITASRSASKQFLYSPLRSAGEKELPPAKQILPYPPSFIYITTTNKPNDVLNYNSVEVNKMPDFFSHRQFKSLWDSYIPSWQTMKFMQKFLINSNRNNLQTLAFTKEGKKKIEK